MNGLIFLAIACVLVAALAVAWALKERVRAVTAEARLSALQDSGEAVRAQLNQSRRS